MKNPLILSLPLFSFAFLACAQDETPVKKPLIQEVFDVVPTTAHRVLVTPTTPSTSSGEVLQSSSIQDLLDLDQCDPERIHTAVELATFLNAAIADPTNSYVGIVCDLIANQAAQDYPENATLVFLKPGNGIDFTNAPLAGLRSAVRTPYGLQQIFYNAPAGTLFGQFGGDSVRFPEWWGARSRVLNFGSLTGFDNHPFIQAAVDSFADVGAIQRPGTVKLQGFQYLVGNTIQLGDKLVRLEGSGEFRRTTLTAMDNFAGPDYAFDRYYGTNGAEPVSPWGSGAPFKTVIEFGSAVPVEWDGSFLGGVSKMHIDANGGGASGNVAMSCLYASGWVGENTIFEDFSLAGFNRYGIGTQVGSSVLGLAIQNFVINGFGFTSDETVLDQPVPIHIGGGYGWSIKDGSIVASGLGGLFGIVARAFSGAPGRISGVHIESCYDGIFIPNDKGIERGSIKIDSIDAFQCRRSLISIQGIVNASPAVNGRNIRPSIVAHSLGIGGIASVTPQFIVDGSHPVLPASLLPVTGVPSASADVIHGFFRTGVKITSIEDL